MILAEWYTIANNYCLLFHDIEGQTHMACTYKVAKCNNVFAIVRYFMIPFSLEKLL